MNTNVDFLIVGQGLAGSLLAWKLIHAGQRVRVIDQQHQSCSSLVSAGVINPVKGIHYTLVEDFEYFFDQAEQTYAAIEKELNINFFKKTPIIRIFRDAEVKQKYDKRRYPFEWLQVRPPHHFSPTINDLYGSVTISKTALCDTGVFLNAMQSFLQEKNCLVHDTFDHDKLIVKDTHVEYDTIHADKVIFTEGARVINNPWFNTLPWQLSKGELLTIKITSPFDIDAIVKSNAWIIPQGDKVFTVGATYNHENLEEKPSTQARDILVEGLKKSFNIDFDVIDHITGIRPILEDHFPVLGTHPDNKHVVIFNGLASKGWLWGPDCASMMTAYLLEQQPITNTFSINRFT